MSDQAEAQRMLRDSATAIVPADNSLTRIRSWRQRAPGFDKAVWREMGELGWIGLRLPEEHGGSGLGMVEAIALIEELGRGLVPEPLIAGMLSASALAAAGETDWLPRLVAGEVYIATAWQEAPDTLDAPGTDAPRLFIPMAAGADAFLLPINGGLRIVEGTATTQPTQDGGHVGTLAPAPGTDLPGAALALDEAALATAAYLLGAMERCFAMTLDYLKTRHQFGKPLGSFQALQHRAADLAIQIRLTRASVEGAAATLDRVPGTPAAQAAVSRAKARAAEAAMLVTREAVQMHGAIGYTDEHDIGLFLRKAMVLANQYGSAAFHRRRFMATSPEDMD